MALNSVILKDMLEVSACRMCELGTDLRGVVYLAQGPPFTPYDDMVKIGFTSSLIHRIPQLTERFEGDVCMEHVIWTDDPPYLEARFHDLFSARRADVPDGREWFVLTDEDRDWFAGFEAINTWIVKDCIDEPESTYIYRENMNL